MAWKVANYNALKKEADSMKARYQNLQKVVSQTNVQMASLQLYAKEVSVAFGINKQESWKGLRTSPRRAKDGAQLLRKSPGI